MGNFFVFETRLFWDWSEEQSFVLEGLSVPVGTPDIPNPFGIPSSTASPFLVDTRDGFTRHLPQAIEMDL